jgi:hypothetical protein
VKSWKAIPNPQQTHDIEDTHTHTGKSICNIIMGIYHVINRHHIKLEILVFSEYHQNVQSKICIYFCRDISIEIAARLQACRPMNKWKQDTFSIASIPAVGFNSRLFVFGDKVVGA